MQFVYILSTIVVAVTAQEYYEPSGVTVDTYPEWYVQSHPRERRDLTVDKKIGDGRIFGTVGQNDAGLFGKGGYEHQIFNDNRGKLHGEVYGKRILGFDGDSSHLGGALKWQNPNAVASFDLSRQIHGGTSYQAAAGGRWPIGRNADFSLQGTYGREAGMRRQYGGLANFNYHW